MSKSEFTKKRLPNGRFPPGEVTILKEQHEKLKTAVRKLLSESPLLEGEPHEGSVTGRLVKEVLEAMK